MWVAGEGALMDHVMMDFDISGFKMFGIVLPKNVLSTSSLYKEIFINIH
jgi:hypothetical protein